MEEEYFLCDLDFVDIKHNKVILNWHRRWANRGMYLGEGLFSPDKKYFYINIPKNASSSIKNELTKLGWDFGHIREFPKAQPIVVLRDPVERWISGIAEYLLMYHADIIDNLTRHDGYNALPILGQELGLSLIFDTITFDDHTDRQTVFLNDCTFFNCIWVKLDKEFNQKFSRLLNDIGYENQFELSEKENDSDNSILKRDLKHLFRLILDKNHDRRKAIEEWFWCDYELLNKMEFYD